MKKLLQNIFSIKNHKNHKVITIFMIKFKFLSDKLCYKSILDDCLQIKNQAQMLQKAQKETINALEYRVLESINSATKETIQSLNSSKKLITEQNQKNKKIIIEEVQKNRKLTIEEIQKNRKQASEELQKTKRHIHRHIDFLYRDLMIVLENKLNFVLKHNLYLKTDYPVAYKSNDHIVPHGTVRDNTRFPRFIRKCEMLCLIKKSSFLFLI